MNIIIGVEGGGTYTRAAVLSIESLEIISYAQGGPSNYHNIGLRKTIRNVVDTINAALKEVGRYTIKHITLGLPAMNSKYDIKKLENSFKRVFPNLNINIEHDVHIALYGATRGKPGILVVAGTGCNVYGYLNGKRYYAGNWGWRVGDEGSAYKVGIATLNLALREYDQRVKEMGILKEVLSYLKFRDAEQLIYWINNASVEEIANISILACKLAENYDEVYRIILNSSRELSKAVYAVRKRMDIRIIPLYYTGGLFNCPLFTSKFIQYTSKIKGLQIQKLKIHPLIGALLISLNKLNIEADPVSLNKKLMNIMRC
mgnify:CR=1 FL=1